MSWLPFEAQGKKPRPTKITELIDRLYSESKQIPAKSLFGFGLFCHGFGGCFRDFHERQFQTSQNLDEKLVVFFGQITAGLFAQSVEHVDHFARAFEVYERATGLGVSHATEHGGGVAREEVHQHLKTAR